MKKFALLTAAFLAISGMAVAQDATIGTSTTGSVSSMAMYYKGNARNTGSWNGVNGNIWNNCWFFYDGSTAVFADQNFTAHTNQVVNGTTGSTATSITNTGMTFGSTTAITGLTADLSVTATEPTPGSVAQYTWAWTFSNSNGSPMNLRIVWFVDGDIAFGGGAYDDNFVGFTTSSNNGVGAIGQGQTDGSGGVSLESGILIDSNTAPTYRFGLSDNNGPSYYWSNQPNYAGNGIEVQNEIAAAYQDIVQQDANTDQVSDSAADAGMAMQFDVIVPASGSTSIETYLLFSPDSADIAEVNDWTMY